MDLPAASTPPEPALEGACVMTREGCHLCELTITKLSEILPDYGVPLQLVDVDTDPELQAEYGDRVPVVLLDGREFSYGTLDEARLRAKLDGQRH